MRRGKQFYCHWLLTILGCLFLALAVGKLPTAISQTQENQANQLEASESTQPGGPDHKESKTDTDRELFLRPSKIDERLEQMSDEEIRKRPFLHFRRTMNRPPKIGACFFVLTMFGVAVLLLRRSDVLSAKDICRKKFFRSFLVGFVTVLSLSALARPLYLSEIGIPLALAFFAVVELGLGLGLVVSASLIGERIADLSAVNRIGWITKRPAWQSIVHLILGTLLFSIILLIPGIGHLPRLGTRIVFLIGIAGLGAFIKSKSAQCSTEKQ